MQEADHILIPLLDGKHALAQVARIERERALVLLTERISTSSAKTKAIDAEDVIASVIVTPDALTKDQWPVVGYDAVPRIEQYIELFVPIEDPIDPALAEALANALHGLYPWDGFPDPAFFDGFLRDGVSPPESIRLSADFPKPGDT